MSNLSNFATFSNDRVNNELLNKSIYVGVDNLLPNRGGKINSDYVPTSGFSTRFKKGDILIGNIRPYFKKIWLANHDGGCSPDVLCIRPLNKKHSNFLYFCLSQDTFFEYNMAGSKGSKMPRGDKHHILNFPITIIENYEAAANLLLMIERQINKNKEMVQKLQVLARSTFHYLFANFSSKKEFLSSFIVENNKSMLQVNEVEDTKGIIPFFTSGETVKYIDEPLVDGFNLFLSTGGNASIKSYYGKASYSTDTWCITANNNMQFYVYEYLKMIENQMDSLYFHGTGLKHLQKPLFLNSEVPVPSKNLTTYNAIVGPIFKKISDIDRITIQLSGLKINLLPLLINGQLV